MSSNWLNAIVIQASEPRSGHELPSDRIAACSTTPMRDVKLTACEVLDRGADLLETTPR